MGITFDGDRARKREWFVKKLLRTLEMLDLPAKSVKLNGFLCKAWREDNLSGGRVTSPMGISVLYHTDRGVSLMVADSVTDGFTSRTLTYLLTDDTLLSGAAVTLFDAVSEEDMIAAGFATTTSDTPVSESPYFALAPDDYSGAVWHRDALPTPCLIQISGSESFWVNTNVNLNTAWNLSEANRMFYAARGENLGGRMTLLSETVSSSTVGSKTIQFLPSANLRACHTQQLGYGSTPAVGKYVGLVYKGDVNGMEVSGYYDINTLVSNLPSGLGAAINHADSTTKSVGSYTFSSVIDDLTPTLLTGMDITNTTLGGSSPSAEDDYFTANPSQEHYRLCYHFMDLGSATIDTVDSSQFIALLDHLATTTSPASDWNYARLMFYQLWPRPAHNYTVPHDSVMFHAEDGNVYVWTRLYNSTTCGNFGGDSFNAFRFTRTGLFITELVIPSIVETTTGVRPTITYAGEGLYLCVCETLEAPLRVHEIHVGSPFSAWEVLPVPTDGDNLVHVRPVRVKLNDVVLLGVIEDAEGLYYFAVLEYKDTIGTWQRMAKIPAVRPDIAPDEANWAVGLFGEGEYVTELSQYMSPQVAFPQMPVGPYTGYAGGMP